ncbi:MAG: hypothetical protein ACYC6C_02385 [Coriobacteriia bacterium]
MDEEVPAMLTEGLAILVTVAMTIIVGVTLVGSALWVLGFILSAPVGAMIAGEKHHHEHVLQRQHLHHAA